ncbi:MAG: PKD domain-containing protein [Candidatus Zixiibacteriota bacterium]
MMKNNQIIERGHVLRTFLLVLGLISLLSLPAFATGICEGECDSYLVNENHEIPDGDPSLCETPVANFCACPRAACGELDVQFTDWSIGCIDTWEWNFGDPNSGSDNYSNEENPTHFYSAPGTYTVTLKISGAAGNETRIKTDYIVVRGYPIADFTVLNQSGCAPIAVQFEDHSVDAAAWLWHFGDGTTSTDQNPTHSYAASGTYTVSLEVRNECGKDIKTKETTIEVGEPPTADFSADQTNFCVGGEVAFTDESTLADTWAWDFGDGSTSIDQNPTHMYTIAGTYTVTLTVTNACGTDSETKDQYITVQPLPTSDFSVAQTTVCAGTPTRFTNLSTNATSWVWDFGNGVASTAQNPTITYVNPGSYTVTLTAINNCGRDIERKELYITVITGPTADFYADATQGCVDGTIHFTDASLHADTWSWDFGDGGTSTAQNPSHIYSATGTYTVSLTVMNDCGDDTETKEYYITINQLPIAQFDYELDRPCIDEPIDFTNESQYATSYSWDFGDGTTSIEENPTHAYSQPGTYTVTLTASNACGSDEYTHPEKITILEEVTIDFTGPNKACVNELVQFTDQSTNATYWYWSFGDGETAVERNPEHRYTAPGTYTVSLQVHNDCNGDQMSKIDFITVTAPPEALFSPSLYEGCAPLTVHFTDFSTGADSYHWRFESGQTSTEQNPSHTFTTPGYYDVILTVGNDCGDSDYQVTIHVLGYPTADFDADNRTVCIDQPVQFDNNSQDAYSYLWYFGDGTTSTETNPSHSYSSYGEHDVSLIAYGECGDDTLTRDFYIYVQPEPTADFSAISRSECLGIPIYFESESKNATTFSWDFGDGSTSTAENPNHTYAAAGTYSVSLAVSNNCGSDTETKFEYIIIYPPTVSDFSMSDDEICIGKTISFTNESEHASSYSWDFGDGVTSTDESPSHSYTAAGTYTVSLQAFGICGNPIKEKTVWVDPTPTAEFTTSVNDGCESNVVTLTNLSQNGKSYSWDFGDGETSTSASPGTHTYAATGTYTIRLVVTNDCGTDGIEHPVTITEVGMPVADFIGDPLDICAGQSVSFTNLSTNAYAYQWHFGDGSSSSETNPSHTYSTAGRYTVTLMAANECGADTTMKSYYVVVRSNPIADFYTYSYTFCTGDSVAFNDDSQDATTWSWDFGDGATSTERYPYHAYTSPGTYTVSLTVTNACGDDTETKVNYLTINPTPIADFTTDGTQFCVNTPIEFDNQSSYGDTYLWNFGDGTTSTDPNPTHTYAAAGTYTISLTATNDCGDDTETKTEYLVILETPIADFSAKPRSICTGGEVAFADNSTHALTWIWDFGDGATSTVQNPTHTYTTAGIYAVSLTVTNPCGYDTETKYEYITVSPAPIADFNMEVNRGCVNTDMYFYDASSNADTWSWDFGDGATSDIQNPTHAYSSPGSYTITLTVTNDCGSNTYSQADYVTIYGGPTADFSATPRSGGSPLMVSFTDQSTSPFTILSWAWDFGDGATSNAQNPTHEYTAAGLYAVTLVVTDQCGSDTERKTEYIQVSDTCTADFTAEPTSGCGHITVTFAGSSLGACDITAWKWNFGDPASGIFDTASGQYVTHTYANAGTFTVTMTAVEADGDIIVTKDQNITVIGAPIADFDATPMTGNAPLTVSFTNRSATTSGSIVGYEWDFGDPNSGSDNTSTLEDPQHTFDTDGTYTVSLTTSNECYSDTETKIINVGPSIEVIKEVDRIFAREGEQLTYTLTVRNHGIQALGNILLLDSIPDMTSYIPGSADNGGAYDVVGDRVMWNIAGIAGGSDISVTFKIVLDGPFPRFPSTVMNIASATYDDTNVFAAAVRTVYSNQVETIVDIPLGGDLGVQKEVDAALASPGDILTYTITVINDNNEAATNVVVYDAIPDSTSYVAGSISAGGTYDPTTDSLTWNLGTMNPFESRVVTFQVVIDADIEGNIRIPNTALVLSSLGGDESNEVITSVSTVPMVITKRTSTPSGMVGDLMRFTITIENFAADPFTNVQLIDTMPTGLYYIDGSTLIDGAKAADPTGTNPITWSLGNLPAGATMTVQYSALVSASAHPGLKENVARSTAVQNGIQIYSNRAIARVYIIGETFTGSIRGRVIVDCDGDGIADMDTVPSGIDVYLDDGSHSKVNEKGMFYFSTVRAGERVVALDERDLDGFYIPEGEQSSVFAHVHETGESYIIFRVCPEYAKLDIRKEAAIIPKVKIIKKATLHPEQTLDSLGVLVDYEIEIKSNGLSDPTAVKIVDSFPDNTMLILNKHQVLEPKEDGSRLVYEITAAQERMHQSAYYSLRDLAPGVRRFMTNKIYLEGEVGQFGNLQHAVSEPAEVNVGPFLMVPPQDVNVTLTPALFITSKAELQPPAIPQLEAVADSIQKYADADIRVEGHTDYRPIHTEEFPSNWELGEARAKAVVDWLVDNRDVERDRLKYESFAATRPVVQVGTTSEQLQPNRRTEVIIQAKVAGYVDPALLNPESWVSSTALALTPTNYDTTYEVYETPLEVDLDDSWEVVLVIENSSAIASDAVTLTDILPEGTEYIAGTATMGETAITPTVSGRTIAIAIDNIEPSQTIEVRYRIRAIDGATPTGGGAASIEVTTAQNAKIVQKSNEVVVE